jgi:hypothetical protein
LAEERASRPARGGLSIDALRFRGVIFRITGGTDYHASHRMGRGGVRGSGYLPQHNNTRR